MGLGHKTKYQNNFLVSPNRRHLVFASGLGVKVKIEKGIEIESKDPKDRLFNLKMLP